MKVRELIAELEKLDPEAEVRFFHLKQVRKDGTGRVESYPVLAVSEAEGEVSLEDFLSECPCLYQVKEVEWVGQPALKSCQPGDFETDEEPQPPAPTGEPPLDTLLIDPPFTREEWSSIKVEDIGENGTPLGRRVWDYLLRYRHAVMQSNRLDELMAAAGLPRGSQKPLTERLIQDVLQRLAESDDHTVQALEMLIAAADFACFLTTRQGLEFGPKTLGWVEKAEALALMKLIVCVNKHFGLVR